MDSSPNEVNCMDATDRNRTIIAISRAAYSEGRRRSSSFIKHHVRAEPMAALAVMLEVDDQGPGSPDMSRTCNDEEVDIAIPLRSRQRQQIQ